mgnify:CR=1 FL=1
MTNSVDVNLLKSYVERMEHLQDEAKAIRDDVKELKQEMEGNKIDSKAVMKLVKLRAQDKMKVAEEDFILGLYRQAMGV